MLQASGNYILDKLSTDTFFFYDRLLEASKNETIVRSQDLFTLVRYVSLNKYGESMAWDWVTLNWDYLVKRWVCQNKMANNLQFKLQIMLLTHPVNHKCDVSNNQSQAIKQEISRVDTRRVISWCLSCGILCVLGTQLRTGTWDVCLTESVRHTTQSYSCGG